MHRINTGPYENKKPKAAVLLVHGLIDSSDTWIMNGRNNSVAFILADAGYDVWLANCRGNKYSMNHTYLDPSKDFLYWDNTHNFIARFDIPAFIEYAKKESMVPKVSYIAHSIAT
jgi:lysosomal acid lipase/cholesteryl ester hydrolase